MSTHRAIGLFEEFLFNECMVLYLGAEDVGRFAAMG